MKAGATRLQQTLTNSNILHPDLTEVTNSYPTSGSRMSTSLLSSRRSSMASSMVGSVDDLRMDFGTSTFSTNLGLSYVLNERNIHGGSNMSLDRFSNISRTGSMSGLFVCFLAFLRNNWPLELTIDFLISSSNFCQCLNTLSRYFCTF